MNHPSRFAFYLVPPYQIARDLAEIHSMLEKQFGFKAAGKFSAHCTIKGFFKKSELPIETLISELDALLEKQNPFQVEFNHFRTKPTSIVLRLENIGGGINQELLDFRGQVVELSRSYIAPDCDFVESDLGPPFLGHFTLAFRDIKPSQHAQVISWLEDAPVPSGKFLARDFQFLEFFSEDWEGNWWETLSWQLLRSWRIG